MRNDKLRDRDQQNFQVFLLQIKENWLIEQWGKYFIYGFIKMFDSDSWTWTIDI